MSMAENRTSFEQMVLGVADAFVELLLAEKVSVKRFSDLVFAGAVQGLKRRGYSMQEIISASGAAAKTVNRYLRDEYHDKKGDVLLQRFLASWASDEELPKVVSMDPTDPPDWLQVCSKHGGELTPNFLRTALEKNGNIVVRDNRIQLVNDAFISNARESATYDYVGWVLAHHIKTIAHNLDNPGDALLERTLYGFQVKPEKREELKAFWTEEISAALNRAREAARQKGFYDDSLPKDDELGISLVMWDEKA